ncbi:hypothetical protein A1OE_1504 [Candidatus Endolissoclinum faulkneri L2]|uniref:Uncharacterized protein n=1 Tax=Candidatus Endolissoclinum faulkneri L2 TaxID=1193729 RepID=K7Z663_9PROT|nr:hypothetical protein A1OE_1504 [Candidatus Endolissoclinum faulkneri L2]
MLLFSFARKQSIFHFITDRPLINQTRYVNNCIKNMKDLMFIA